jgi:hypothetical protein
VRMPWLLLVFAGFSVLCQKIFRRAFEGSRP